jgi:hypothetical protein
MINDQPVILFNYKGRDILVRRKNNKYQIGTSGKNQIALWFESVSYNSLRIAMTSGREYARIVIDKMLLAQKRNE